MARVEVKEVFQLSLTEEEVEALTSVLYLLDLNAQPAYLGGLLAGIYGVLGDLDIDISGLTGDVVLKREPGLT